MATRGRYPSDRKRSWLAARPSMVLISSCMVVQELWEEEKEEDNGRVDGWITVVGVGGCRCCL